MAQDPIQFDDIVNLGDGLKKAIKEFQKLDKIVEKTTGNMVKSIGKFDKSIQDMQVDLRKNVQISEQLSKANDKNGKELDQAAKSADNLTTSISQTTKAKKEAVVMSDMLSKSVNDQKKRVKLLQAEYDSLDPTLDGNTQKMRQLSKSLVRTRADIKQLTDASKRANATFDSSEKSYNGLIKANKRISEILRKLPPEFIKVNKRAQELQNTFLQNTKQLKSFDKALGQNFRNVGNYGDALSKLNGIAAGSVKLLGALGIAGAIGLGAKKLAESVIQLEKNSKAISKLFKVGGKDLDNFTARATALVDVFDQDFNQVIKTANTLQKQLGTTGTEAFDLIEQSLIRGVNLNDDFLEQLSEYSVFFKEAGLSGQQLVDVLLQGEGQGIFSDKALDAVKEASIRLRELPKSTQDALEGLGISVSQLQKDLGSGAKTVFDIIQDVSKELSKLPDNAQVVGTAIADIFGGAGEDAGLAFLRTLKDIDTAQDDWRDSLNDSQKAQQGLLDSQKNLNAELLNLNTGFATTGKTIKTFFNNLLAGSVAVLSDLVSGLTDTNTLLADFRKELKLSSDVAVLTSELEKLKKSVEDPTAFVKFRRFLLLAISPDLFAKNIGETVAKIGLFEDRIVEISEETAKKQVENAKKAGAERTKADNESLRARRKAIRDLADFELNQQIRLLEETVVNEEASLNERLGALDLITEKKIDLAELARDGELDVARTLIKEERQLIDERAKDLEAQAEKDGEKRGEALIKGTLKALKEGDISAFFDKQSRNQLNLLETAKNKELQVIEESNLSINDKQQERFDVEEDFRKQSLQRQLFFLQKTLAIAKLEESERIAIAKNISEIELELSKSTNEQKEIDIGQFVDAVVAVQESLFEFGQVQIDNELMALEQKQDNNQAFLDRELLLAGDNEVAKNNIKLKFLDEDRKIEREKRKLQREAAVAQKKASLFSAILSLAQGVATALGSAPPPANFILAALVAIAGGIQIAAIQSQALPAFAEGTDSAPGGVALVGEVGKELVYDSKTGKAVFTPSKPTLMDIPAGAQIFDAMTTKQMMMDGGRMEDSIGIHSTNDNVSIGNSTLKTAKNKYLASKQHQSGTVIDYERLGREVGKNLPPSQIWEIGNDNRMRFFTKDRKGNRTEHKNKETDFISYKNPIVKEMRDIKRELSKLDK